MFEQNENVSIAFDDRSGVMSVTITGMASVAGVTRPLRHPDLDRTCCMLWDVRGACLSALHPSALMEIAEHYAAWGCKPVARGVAIVVTEPEAEILARLYREILRHTMGCNMAHKITNSMRSARAWLGGGADVPVASNDDHLALPEIWSATALQCCGGGNKS